MKTINKPNLAISILIPVAVGAFSALFSGRMSYSVLNKPPAAYLQIPYLLWCLFAAYLNYTIYTLN